MHLSDVSVSHLDSPGLSSCGRPLFNSTAKVDSGISSGRSRQAKRTAPCRSRMRKTDPEVVKRGSSSGSVDTLSSVGSSGLRRSARVSAQWRRAAESHPPEVSLGAGPNGSARRMYSRVYLYIGRYPPPPAGITFILVVAISVEERGRIRGKY